MHHDRNRDIKSHVDLPLFAHQLPRKLHTRNQTEDTQKTNPKFVDDKTLRFLSNRASSSPKARNKYVRGAELQETLLRRKERIRKIREASRQLVVRQKKRTAVKPIHLAASPDENVDLPSIDGQSLDSVEPILDEVTVPLTCSKGHASIESKNHLIAKLKLAAKGNSN